MARTLKESYQGLVEPGYILFIAMYYFLITVYETVWVDRSPRKLFPLGEFRAKAFSRFWLAVSPPPDAPERPADDPESSFVNVPGYLATASGTVLDVGPGSGTFATYLNAPSIKAIYGAEPAVDMHSALKESARVAGLDEKYRILSCGGERASLLPALVKAGLLKETEGGKIKEEPVFDTIICLRVLCSIPDLEASLATLYSLLKPGGRFIICEHVINPWRTPKGSIFGRIFQHIYTLLGWPFFIGDCHLDRDTPTVLKKIGDSAAGGGWESVELDKKMEWTALPFTTGLYIKKGTINT